MRLEKKDPEKKKRTRLPLHIYLSYLLVITLIFTGVTFSRYITMTSAGDSARVAVFGDLEIRETTGKEYIVTPGVPIKKDPQISFAHTEDTEMAAYVFVSVDAEGWTFQEEKDSEEKSSYQYRIYPPENSEKEQDTVLLEWQITDGWTYLKEDGRKQIFYRTVNPGEKLEDASLIRCTEKKKDEDSGETKTEIIKDHIWVSEELYRSELEALDFENKGKNITFQAYAVQALGFADAAEAWESVK